MNLIEKLCLVCNGVWNKKTNNYSRLCNNCYNSFISYVGAENFKASQLKKYIKLKNNIKESIEAWK